MDKLKIVFAASFKYIFTAIVSFAILDVFFKNLFIHVLLISFIMTIVNYFVGTIYIFKIVKYKFAASIVGLIDGIILYLASTIIDGFYVKFGVILIYIVSMAVFEFYYNKYMYAHMA